MPANRFELLVSWYLRFNGYFTTPDFTVHPSFKKQPGGTDADVLAVRFPHSLEYQARFQFERDERLVRKDRIDFAICEVKAGTCDLNANTWRNRERENVEYAIRWMGFADSEALLKECAERIYERGAFECPGSGPAVRFLAFGRSENPKLKAEMPEVQQILHTDVIRFLRKRFTTGCCGITRHNWDTDIIAFAERCRDWTEDEAMAWAASGSGSEGAG